MKSRDLTQHGFSFLLSFFTTIISLSLTGLFISDYFLHNYISTFPTTYLMIAASFISFVNMLLTLSLAKKESYLKAKPTFHRIFITLTIVLLISTLIGGTSPLNSPEYSWVGFGVSFLLFFVHVGSYNLVIQIDRSTGDIDKYFQRKKIVHKRRKK